MRKNIEYQIICADGSKGNSYQDKEAAEKELQKLKKQFKGQCSSRIKIKKFER